MADQGASLLAAIVAAPDDDDLRLVYADWLMTRNDPRGELIQLGHQATRTPAIDRRIAELENRVTGSLARLGVTGRFTLERGFVVALTGHVPSATTVPQLADLEPFLDRFDLTVDGQRDRMQLARPKTTAVLARARVLAVRGLKTGNTRAGRGPIADLSGVAATPFPRLRSLDLVRLRIAPAHVGELLNAARGWPALERLHVSSGLPAAELAQVATAVDDLRAARPELDLLIS